MESTQRSRRIRIGLGIVLLAAVILLIVYFSRSSQSVSRHDPNVGKETGVVIEGTILCNDQPLPGGYVVAWQGPPVAFGDVQNDGTYRIENAPLGKCILTYSAVPPETRTLKHNVDPSNYKTMPEGFEKGLPPKDKELPPKTKDSPSKSKSFSFFKDKFLPPKDKDASAEDKGLPFKFPFPPKEKGFPPKDGFSKDKGPDDPLGKMLPPPAPGIQLLPPEQKRFVDQVAEKYRDPTDNLIPFQAKKGNNTFDIRLLLP